MKETIKRKETQTWIPDGTDSMYGEYDCAFLECKEDIPAKTMAAVFLDWKEQYNEDQRVSM